MSQTPRLFFLFFLWFFSARFSVSVFSQESRPLSASVDTFTVKVSPVLAGRVDSTDLLLAAKAVVEGDSIKHRWLLRGSLIELRLEEQYRSFPKIRFFRFLTPDSKLIAGRSVAIDREAGKAYILYPTAPDDFGQLALDKGITIASEPAALEYFLDVLQIRGYQPAIVLDTVAEIRQFLGYRERAAGLRAAALPPVRRFYRHMWNDRNFSGFKGGSLSEEGEAACRVLEKKWAETIQPPATSFNKGQYSIRLCLVRTSELFQIYEISGYVSLQGLVSYTVKKLE